MLEGEFAVMVEIQSMVPIAAVVDLVLGIATLSIISRSHDVSANNRIVGSTLGWILIFLGLSSIMTSVLEFRYGALSDFSSVDTSKVAGTFLLLVVTMVDLVGDLQDTETFLTNTPDWSISFETQNHTMQAVETVQDDETRNVVFDLSVIDVPDGFMIGYIDIIITSEEESGISGQCDSVAGDLIENELTAQWNDPENNLSGQDSSCIPIELDLTVSPNFDGETFIHSAINEYQATQNWTETGWGVGDLSVDLNLDVNAPPGLDPLGMDSDEEITIDVTVVMFKPIISLIE